MKRIACVASILVGVVSPAVAQPSFVVLPSTPQTTASMQAWGVSDDGNTVIGFGARNGSHVLPFVWRRGVGTSVLNIPVPGDTRAFAISPDGLFATGWATQVPTASSMIRWDLVANTYDLAPTSDPGTGFAVSPGGRYVAGQVGAVPARWDTASNTITPLAEATSIMNGTAFGMTPDGAVITGGVTTLTMGPAAFRWSESGGMQLLPAVPGSNEARGRAISADGDSIALVVGFPGAPGEMSPFYAYRWTESGGMQDLGTLPGPDYSEPYAMSADGLSIVGNSGGSAFLWTAAEGMRDLNTLLPALGVDLHGLRLQQALGMSADGRTIVGDANDEFGHTVAWVATIPSPSALSLLVLGLAGMRRRR